jgi:hypothetical protein
MADVAFCLPLGYEPKVIAFENSRALKVKLRISTCTCSVIFTRLDYI